MAETMDATETVMTEWQAWVGCMVAGVMTLVLAVLILPLFPATAVGDISPYTAPVYAFEFARTPADLLTVFGEVGDPDRAQRLDAMDRGNRWDFLFMAVYTVFGALFGWAVIKSGARNGWPILVAALVAGLADAVETGFLLSITDALRDGTRPGVALEWLRVPVVIKFAGIAAVLIGAGSVLMDNMRGVWKLVGIAPFLAGFIIMQAAFDGALIRYAGQIIGVGWIVMIAFAAWRAKIGPIPLRRRRL